MDGQKNNDKTSERQVEEKKQKQTSQKDSQQNGTQLHSLNKVSNTMLQLKRYDEQVKQELANKDNKDADAKQTRV